MGTHCFFAESKRPGSVQDACFQEMPSKLYEYHAKSNKVLKMKRIFVEENESENQNNIEEGEIENLEHLRVTKTYEEALNQFLKPGEEQPREIVEVSDQQENFDSIDDIEMENLAAADDVEETDDKDMNLLQTLFES